MLCRVYVCVAHAGVTPSTHVPTSLSLLLKRVTACSMCCGLSVCLCCRVGSCDSLRLKNKCPACLQDTLARMLQDCSCGSQSLSRFLLQVEQASTVSTYRERMLPRSAVATQGDGYYVCVFGVCLCECAMVCMACMHQAPFPYNIHEALLPCMPALLLVPCAAALLPYSQANCWNADVQRIMLPCPPL